MDEQIQKDGALGAGERKATKNGKNPKGKKSKEKRKRREKDMGHKINN